MTWDQIKEVADSGLVTISSHSDNLHQFVDANPQGNIEPSRRTPLSMIPRRKNMKRTSSFRERIRDDLARSAEILSQTAGDETHRPHLALRGL